MKPGANWQRQLSALASVAARGLGTGVDWQKALATFQDPRPHIGEVPSEFRRGPSMAKLVQIALDNESDHADAERERLAAHRYDAAVRRLKGRR